MRKFPPSFLLLLRSKTVSKFKTKNNKECSNLAGKILYFDVLFSILTSFPMDHKTFCLSHSVRFLVFYNGDV